MEEGRRGNGEEKVEEARISPFLWGHVSFFFI